MSNTAPILVNGFIFGFNMMPFPEGKVLVLESGEPNPDIISLAMKMMMIPPNLCFGVVTKDDKMPLVSEIFMVAREKYLLTSDNPPINEAFGVLLDTLKIMDASSIKFEEGTNLSPDADNATINNNFFSSLLVNGNIVGLRILRIEMFSLNAKTDSRLSC